MKTDCCCEPPANSNACGCCEGLEALTPLPTANRPGLPALSYRVGTHAVFLETMKARLSSSDYPKLAELTIRAADDPSIAMLDAWATVADVLTFYQERIANEGYLRTATERRSVLELARLVGYQPRPGVSSSVYLAYTLDDNFTEEVIIPIGARSQSIPDPGELPQSFEISEVLKARTKWNNLKPRTSKPQEIKFDDALGILKIYLKGTATNLKANDPLLLVYGENSGEKILRRVEAVKADFDNGRTEASLQEVPILIRAFVDFMREILAVLDKQLSKEQFKNDNSEHDALIRWLINLRNFLKIILDNFSLGKYPPRFYKTSFSHDRIYNSLSLNRGIKALNANIYSVLILEMFAGVNNIEHIWQLFRDGGNTSVAVTTLPQWFVDAVWQQIQKSLKKFRPDIICLFRYFLQQALPADPSEKEILIDAVRAYDESFEAWKKRFKDGWDEEDKALRLLLSDPELHKDFSAFLDSLLGLFKDQEVPHILIAVQDWLVTISVDSTSVQCGAPAPATTSLDDLIAPGSPLIQAPSRQIANSLHLPREIGKLLSKNAGAVPEMLINFQPRLKPVLYQAWANATVKANVTKPMLIQKTAMAQNRLDLKDISNDEALPEPPELISVHALRLSAAPFGSNAPVKMGLKPPSPPIPGINLVSVPDGDWDPSTNGGGEEENARLYLDNAFDNVVEGAYVVVNNLYTGIVTAAIADKLTVRPRTAYTMSGKTTQIELSKDWWAAREMESLRKTMVYVETEKLSLALQPDTEPVPDSEQSIHLQALYDGLSPGRWVIVSGELLNVPGDTAGVKMAELAMLAAVEHVFDEHLPGGDKTHTRITFDKKLVNSYKRDTVTIYGNVVKATHGETCKESLGSGDGAKALQSFDLKQAPLTFVSASNPSGVDSTLSIFVNEIKWQETATLAGLSPADRNFITKTGDDGNTTLVFGNGREGARLPTGIENIKAEYRNGIGKPGNVKAGQITLLTTRPPGVKEVINPLKASGGADKETRDQARKNAPLAVMALDRLVSVQDYEDFVRIYAGIGKARAVEISDGRRQLVHITVAGADDIPVDKDSDLYRNLHKSLLDLGDPYQAIRIEIRELMLIVLGAGIRIKPGYQWEPVVTQISKALLGAFSFDRRELGQDVLLSEVMSIMQGVRGVVYVDIDTFGGIPELILDKIIGKRRLLTPKEISSEVTGFVSDIKPRLRVNLAGYKDKDGNIEKDAKGNIVLHPAQLAFLTPDVPETLVLNQIP